MGVGDSGEGLSSQQAGGLCTSEPPGREIDAPQPSQAEAGEGGAVP